MNVMHIDDAVTHINQGAVGVMLTDTVYGLVCQTVKRSAVQRIYELKQRRGKPGTVLTASADDALSLGVSGILLNQAQQFWPGPISVVLPCLTDNLDYLHCGNQSLAIRVPHEPQLRELLRRTGPLLTSSANITSQPVAKSLQEAYDYFGDSVDFYVRPSWQPACQPSTVVQLSDDGTIVVLREGAMGQATTEGFIRNKEE